MFFGQAEQDKFIINVLKKKKNGYFLEIGSHTPININNTYLLEKNYDWKGAMVEIDESFLNLYKIHRPNSIHLMNDATKINYKEVFIYNNFPFSMDYLQIDLEANNGSTIETLEKLDDELFEQYKFATVTFEHDIYRTNYANTRLKSREIFNKRGYVLVFPDINDSDSPFEDWYIHPDLVDMNYVNELIEKNKKNYKNNTITGESINWKDILY